MPPAPAARRILLTGLLLLGISGCQLEGHPWDPIPLEYPIDVSLLIQDLGYPEGSPVPQRMLHIVLRTAARYPDTCHTLFATGWQDPETYWVRAEYVYIVPEMFCQVRPSRASATIPIGSLTEGTFALMLGDRERFYPGIMRVIGDTLRITFPDTSRFHLAGGSFLLPPVPPLLP